MKIKRSIKRRLLIILILIGTVALTVKTIQSEETIKKQDSQISDLEKQLDELEEKFQILEEEFEKIK